MERHVAIDPSGRPRRNRSADRLPRRVDEGRRLRRPSPRATCGCCVGSAEPLGRLRRRLRSLRRGRRQRERQRFEQLPVRSGDRYRWCWLKPILDRGSFRDRAAVKGQQRQRAVVGPQRRVGAAVGADLQRRSERVRAVDEPAGGRGARVDTLSAASRRWTWPWPPSSRVVRATPGTKARAVPRCRASAPAWPARCP